MLCRLQQPVFAQILVDGRLQGWIVGVARKTVWEGPERFKADTNQRDDPL